MESILIRHSAITSDSDYLSDYALKKTLKSELKKVTVLVKPTSTAIYY
jgi:hypothetical protein